jgi:LacI family transcriptional regulator
MLVEHGLLDQGFHQTASVGSGPAGRCSPIGCDRSRQPPRIACGAKLRAARQRAGPQQLPAGSPAPTAVVCACDEFAYDTIRAAASRGPQVGSRPGRLAVVGCDDSPLAARTVPTLTSLRQPLGRLADRAIDLLTAKGLRQ